MNHFIFVAQELEQVYDLKVYNDVDTEGED